ncbi:MAG: hemolysin III family protein [Bacteroidetes bacterium]|nr:hemolysin III family protein [Bacteroidota bacterium]
MAQVSGIKYYSPIEERINIISHGAGFIASIAALVLLVLQASLNGNVWHKVSFSIFGTSLLLLYAASTLYHSSKKPELRKRLKIIDHASIYILIAGSYTPFTIVTLNGTVGWVIFGIAWGIALTGIILKLFFTGEYNLLSTIMYVMMGWLVVFFIKPLMNNLSSGGLFWLMAGGISYTVGAVIYMIKKIPYNHAIFHIFVLIGSTCHVVSVYLYV